MASLWMRSRNRRRGRLRASRRFWWKAFAAELDRSHLATHTGLVTRIDRDPGRSLSDGDSNNWVVQLLIVAGNDAAAGALLTGSFPARRAAPALAVVTLSADQPIGLPIAFTRFRSGRNRRRTDRGHHLGLVMVNPMMQGQGLSWVVVRPHTLVLFMRGGLRPKGIFPTSPRCRLCAAWSRHLFRLFPSPRPGWGGGGEGAAAKTLRIFNGRCIMRHIAA